jgi:hypothetical protein
MNILQDLKEQETFQQPLRGTRSLSLFIQEIGGIMGIPKFSFFSYGFKFWHFHFFAF